MADKKPIRDVLAENVIPADPVWLLEQPPIPLHGVTVIAGYRAATKTTFACWLTAQVTANGGAVFLCSQEDPLETFIRPRVEAAGANLKLVRFPETRMQHLRLPDDVLVLSDYLKVNGVRLAIFDPLEAVVRGFLSPDKVRDALTQVTILSQALDCAMVFVHHFRKSGGKDVFDAIGGSGAITNAARAVYVYGVEALDPFDALLSALGHGADADGDYSFEEGEEQRVLANAKLSSAPPAGSLAFKLHTVELPGLLQSIPRVTLLGETDVSAESILGARQSARKDGTMQTMVESASTWLLDLLVDGPRKTTELLDLGKAEGFSSRTIERARADLKQRRLITTRKVEGSWWVQLDTPDSLPDEDTDGDARDS